MYYQRVTYKLDVYSYVYREMESRKLKIVENAWQSLSYSGMLTVSSISNDHIDCSIREVSHNCVCFITVVEQDL